MNRSKILGPSLFAFLSVILAAVSATTPVTTTSFFPYISTKANTNTYFQLANTLPSDATVTVTYTDFVGTNVATTTHNLGPYGRKTVNASSEVGAFEGSAKVQTSGAGPVAVEKQVVFAGKTGNTTIGARAPGTNWGLVNGRTTETGRDSSYTNYLIQNVSGAAADVTVDFYDANGKIASVAKQVPAKGFLKFYGYEYPGPNKLFGAHIASSQEIVAGYYQSLYSMNSTSNSSENVSQMIMNPSRTYYSPGGNPLLDGSTSTYYILNAGASAASVNFTFLSPQGPAGKAVKTVPAGTHRSFTKDDLGFSGSAVIESDQPVFAGQTNEWNGGHRFSNMSLTTQAFTNWMLAEGQNAYGIDTFILIQNPNLVPANVQSRFIDSSGGFTNANFQLPAQSSQTFDTQSYVPSGEFSAFIQSSVPITVGRCMYWNNFQYGDSSLGYGYNNSTLIISPTVLNYYCKSGSGPLQSYGEVQVEFSPASNIGWTASSNTSWVSCSDSGSGSGHFHLSLDATGLKRGIHEGTITVTAPGADGSPKTVTVRLEVF